MCSSSRINPQDLTQNPVQGTIIAITIIGLWIVVALWALSSKVDQLNIAQHIAIISGQTFLYTGLFITGHEAMHGLICPHNLKLNHLIGAASVSLYAAFPYRKLLRRHWQHHRHPASSLDPDFHDGQNSSFWAWYRHFLGQYWSWKQFGIVLVVFGMMSYWLHVAIPNIILFVLVPSLLSSLQLFYFGTFLPHRKPIGGYQYPHCARSNTFSVGLSFLTCYHFGYHLEHHQYPGIPWWLLPKVKLLGVGHQSAHHP